MKTDKPSIVTWFSFVELYALVLRMFLDIYGVEDAAGLTIFMGINGSLITSKLSAPTADDVASK